MKNKKVVLGLSGGVDSTTALLCYYKKKVTKSSGYILTPWEKAEKMPVWYVEMAAKQLGIKFLYWDVSDIFREKVIGNFAANTSAAEHRIRASSATLM